MRYCKPLEHLQEQHDENTNMILRVTLLQVHWSLCSSDSDASRTPEELKGDGNKAYKKGDYQMAIKLYTEALVGSDNNVRAVLSNWSQSAINL